MAIEVSYWKNFRTEEDRRKAFVEGPFVIVYIEGYRIEVEYEKQDTPILPSDSVHRLTRKWALYDHSKFPRSQKESAERLCDRLNALVKKGSIVKNKFGIWVVKEKEITPEQKDLIERAFKKNMKTRDPLVNWHVDQRILGESFAFDLDLYKNEIEVWEKTGGEFLS